MLKPLTQEQIDKIMATATMHFADGGFKGANINKIASEAGVSVGVIYKYYEGKEGLFLACVRRSLDYLEEVFDRTVSKGGTLMEMIESLIRENQKAAREHPEYFRLYHHITVSGAPQEVTLEMPSEKSSETTARSVAELIEGASAKLYRALLAQARDAGEVRQDMDPALFAFFFDNLMMMLHYSYACEYYRERFRIYCGSTPLETGDDLHDEKAAEAIDEQICQQLIKFISGALQGGVK